MQFCLQYGDGNEDMVKKAYGGFDRQAWSPLAPFCVVWGGTTIDLIFYAK
jgi:hypothetical protein